MPDYNFWQYITSLQFLVPAGLVLAGFLPLVWSIWRTWEENAYKVKALQEREREARRARRAQT